MIDDLTHPHMATGFRLSEDEYRALLQRKSAGVSEPHAPVVVAPVKATPAVRPQDRMLELGRLPAGTMNGTEAAYAQTLEFELRAGEILWFKFEAMKLRLGKNTFFTPDFAVGLKDGRIGFREVKGHWMEDARVKIKTAAFLYPMFQFSAIRKVRKRDGGGWDREDF